MHENPLSAGPAKDRNHFAGCLLRRNRSSGQSHAQSRPGHLLLDRGDFVVSGTSTVNGSGVTLILTSRTRSDYGAIDLRAGSTIKVTAPARGAAAGIPGPASRIFRRVALRHVVQPADSADGHLHGKFLFSA